MKRKIIVFMLLPLLTLSCYKKRTSNETEKEENYYSLKITTNNPDATNYSVNVDNLNRIKEGTKVTISNTPGYYKIIQFLTSENELLSSDNTYSFEMNENKEIKLSFKYDLDYYNFESKNGNANIIIMAGQSNMQGADAFWNTLPSKTIEDYRQGHNNVVINYHVLYNYTLNSYYSGNFVPVDFGQSRISDLFGPEVGLSKYLGTNDPSNMYYLIKVAWGGTRLIDEWNPDNINKKFADALGNRYQYKILKDSVTFCLNKFAKYNNLEPKIRAFMWAQGESDSEMIENDGLASKQYGQNLLKLQNAVKRDFSDYISEDYKWISALVSNTYGTPTVPKANIDLVNKGLRDYSDKVITETLTLEKMNSLHYTAQSYLKLGEYFGREFLS